MPSLTALVFLAFFAGTSFLAIFRNPFWAIVLYQIEYFANPPIRWWFKDIPHIRYALAVFVVLGVSYLLHFRSFTRARLMQYAAYRWLLLMVMIVCLAYFWAIDPDVHLRWMTTFLKFILFAVLLFKMTDTPMRMEGVIVSYLAGIFYISIVAWQTGRTGNNRLEGIGGPDCIEVNGIAAVLASAVPLLLFYIFYGKNKSVMATSFVALAFVLNGLILMNSRGAFVATAFSAVVFFVSLLRSNVNFSLKMKTFGGIGVGVGLFLYLADMTFWERFKTLQNIDPDEGSGGRFNLWMKTFEMLSDYPQGLGAIGYQIVSPRYLPQEWLTQGQRAVHSLWFEVLSEYGFHGFIVFIAFIASVFIVLNRTKKLLFQRGDLYHALQGTALQASFAAFLVAASFINRFYSEMLYWLSTFIMAFGNIHLSTPVGNEREEAGQYEGV